MLDCIYIWYDWNMIFLTIRNVLFVLVFHTYLIIWFGFGWPVEDDRLSAISYRSRERTRFVQHHPHFIIVIIARSHSIVLHRIYEYSGVFANVLNEYIAWMCVYEDRETEREKTPRFSTATRLLNTALFLMCSIANKSVVIASVFIVICLHKTQSGYTNNTIITIHCMQ